MANIICLEGNPPSASRRSLEDVPHLLERARMVWIDSEGEERGLTQFLTDVLKLHPLAVEDIFEHQNAPKVEDYGDYLYIVVHGIVPPKPHVRKLETSEVDIVVAPNWIFTHHHGDSPAINAVIDELRRNVRVLERGPAFIAHAVLDRLVDAYVPVINAVDDEVEHIESAVIDNPTRKVLERLFRLKRVLQRLRRTSVHQREILQRLSRGEFEVLPQHALPFYRDVYDHFGRVADLADSYRELLSGALDAYLSTVSNRMNEVMKTLTMVATVMMPMSFIVGLYGMNFDHMPELHWRYGYLYVLCLLITVAVVMFAWFRNRRWL